MENKKIKVALVGNPNCGKTSLFNALTGLNQKVANFPGVTVDKKTGYCKLSDAKGNTIDAEIIDLPGTYSLYPKSMDEHVTFQLLCDPRNPLHPDVTLVIADASNLKRSLFLCSQIIDLKTPVVLALNMMDLVVKKGLEINIPMLEKKLGIKVIPINAREKIGIDELKKAISGDLTAPRADFINIRSFAPEVVDLIQKTIHVNSDYVAFQIANNYELIPFFNQNPQKKEVIKSFLDEHKFNSSSLQATETLERYKILAEKVIKDVVIQKDIQQKKQFTSKLDRLLTHKVFGYVFFLLILFLIFQAVFAWSTLPMEWVQKGFQKLSEVTQNALPPGFVNDLLVNGIFAGLSGIVVFIPQIAILFTFIAILEDTGYMARVSFIMDKLLRKFGLNGKSIIPLVSGVACAVPAIMSTRTIQSWKERTITILVTPLMSCSARIPVYTLLISMVVPNRYVLYSINLQGLVLMALYLIGFLTALFAAFLLSLVLKAKERGYYIMEMPVYRMPRWSNIGITIIEKVKIFLFDAGKVIIAISIVLWFLASFGPGDRFKNIEHKYSKTEFTKNLTSQEIKRHIQSEKIAASYAGSFGRLIEPVIKPLGFDWKIGIALITSFAAREAFVGTMATIYSVGEEDSHESIKEKMMADINPQTLKPTYTVAVGYSLMIFYAFAMQCMSTLAVVYRETKSWKIPVFQFAYMGVLAYIASFVIYHIFK
jgi:ferrous iron transport protein B